MKVLLCESNPMCYGSSTVLLSIIDQLSIPAKCLAFGIAKEVLKNGKAEIIEVNNKSSNEVKEVISTIDFDSVLVVSNTSNLELYKSLNKKIYFIHIHYFFPNAQTELLKLVDLLFVQNFWNLNKTTVATLVGPLIKFPKAKRKTKNLVLINFGGGESRFIQPGINSNYGQLMLNLIIQLKQYLGNKEIIICGGSKLIGTIKKEAENNLIKTLTLSYDDYLELLDEAEILISAPGLNAIFEAIYRNIPIIFLPPQNVSQTYQLNAYENFRLCDKGMNLALPDMTFTEEVQTREFLSEMTTSYNLNEVIQKQLNCLVHQIHYIRTKEYVDRTKSARIFLGEIGTTQILKIINDDYRN